MSLSVAFSPCPNDTFMFHAWVHGLVAKNLPIAPVYADIQQLNEWAIQGRYPVTKVSVHMLGRVLDDYALLPVGCALGYGCGPKIVAKYRFDLGDLRTKTIAIPGADTTAHALLQRLVEQPKAKVFCTYAQVLDKVNSGEVDCGLIIHETRFTFAQHGLQEIVDLGELWEQRYHLPIPLGCIIAKKSLGQKMLKDISIALSNSLEYAWKNSADSRSYVLQHSQEKDPTVVQQHIDLYVTPETAQLSNQGRKAIEVLCSEEASCD